MKVKCVQIYNEITKQFQTSSPWLTIGNEYVVLMMEIHPSKVKYLLIGDNENKSPALYAAKQFEIVSHYIPSNWEINPGDTHFEIATLGPKIWQEPDFWEDCYNLKSAALEIYKREAKIILEEELARKN